MNIHRTKVYFSPSRIGGSERGRRGKIAGTVRLGVIVRGSNVYNGLHCSAFVRVQKRHLRRPSRDTMNDNYSLGRGLI